MIKKYYWLTKPGIIYGNVMTGAAGFLFGSAVVNRFNLVVGLATLLGTAFVIASGCVFNNYLDRDIDSKMARTKKRALVTEAMPVVHALIFAMILLALGFLLLAVFTNWLVVIIGLVGFIDYVVLYGWAKRHTIHSTLVGSIAGATAMTAGYCAATGRFDAAAVLVLLLMACWQMPHTYAMAMRRYKDYKAAGVPVLPVAKGMRAAKLQTMAYIVVFIIATSLLMVFGYTGWMYLVAVLALGLSWFYRGAKYWKIEDTTWGKKMFLFSLIVLLGTSLALSVGSILP